MEDIVKMITFWAIGLVTGYFLGKKTDNHAHGKSK